MGALYRCIENWMGICGEGIFFNQLAISVEEGASCVLHVWGRKRRGERTCWSFSEGRIVVLQYGVGFLKA